MTAPTLAEFLLARIEEDEAVARDEQADAMIGTRLKPLDPAEYERTQRMILEMTRRVLADCEAKRAIVKLLTPLVTNVASDDDSGPVSISWRHEDDRVLTALAQPYASHPEFKDEWR